MNVLFVRLTMTAALAAWAGPAPAETVPLTPGYYEVVVSGAPGGGTQTRKRCVTVEHVADPDSVFNYAFAKPYKPLSPCLTIRSSTTRRKGVRSAMTSRPPLR